MRILHGYTSFGLVSGILGTILLLRSQSKIIPVLSLTGLLIFNSYCLILNTWIAFHGMGIPHGRAFHILLAALLTLNFFAINRGALRPINEP